MLSASIWSIATFVIQHVSACEGGSMWVCAYVHECVCLRVCMHLCVYVCVHTCVCVCMDMPVYCSVYMCVLVVCVLGVI